MTSYSDIWFCAQTHIPAVVGQLKKLQELQLSHNQITTVPHEVTIMYYLYPSICFYQISWLLCCARFPRCRNYSNWLRAICSSIRSLQSKRKKCPSTFVSFIERYQSAIPTVGVFRQGANVVCCRTNWQSVRTIDEQ